MSNGAADWKSGMFRGRAKSADGMPNKKCHWRGIRSLESNAALRVDGCILRTTFRREWQVSALVSYPNVPYRHIRAQRHFVSSKEQKSNLAKTGKKKKQVPFSTSQLSQSSPVRSQ